MTAPDLSANEKQLFRLFDIWRVICAFVVALSHAQAMGLMDWPGSLGQAAHHAVIVFFVISGYSVSHSARLKVSTQAFLAQRFSRLWATTVPVLLVALAIGLVARSQAWNALDDWTINKWYLHLPFNALFLGQFGPWAMSPFGLVPYWSLAYEAWYYLFFAVLMLDGSRPWHRAALAVMLIALAPRMILLLPCWLAGVALHRWSLNHSARRPPTARPGITPLVFCMLCLGLYLIALVPPLHVASDLSAQWSDQLKQWGELHLPAPWAGLSNLGYSKWFLGDWMLALLFGLVVAATSARLTISASSLPVVERAWRTLANLSFGVYLLHYPVLKILQFAGLGELPAGPRAAGLVLALGAILGFSQLCETTRPWWRRQLIRQMSRSPSPSIKL
jgi:peptidoglycan/LPS O-acetylase OafA/YrhL